MSEILRHYSCAAISVVESREQIERPDYKPRGLWLSVDNSEYNWRWWCEAESYALDRLIVQHDVTLTDDARILRIGTTAELLNFTEDYGAPMYVYKRPSLDYIGIAWSRVAASWHGIIITPYLWELRLDERTRWYYGWDCASGCIWDAAAIERITATQDQQAASQKAA